MRSTHSTMGRRAGTPHLPSPHIGCCVEAKRIVTSVGAVAGVSRGAADRKAAGRQIAMVQVGELVVSMRNR